MVELSNHKTGSEGNVVLLFVMPPLVLQTVKELEPTIDSFMTGSNRSNLPFLSTSLAVVDSVGLVISSVAFISHDSFSNRQQLPQIRPEDSYVMVGSSERTNVVNNVPRLDVGSNLVPQSKALVLESVEPLLLSEPEPLNLVGCEVSAINVNKTTVASVSNEPVNPPNLKAKC